MDYVPEPFVGLVQVKLQSDCRYGPHDPLHWPQLYSPEFEFLCAMRRGPVQGHLETDPLWHTLQEGVDFVLIDGTIFNCLGLLKPAWVEPLTFLVEDLSEQVDVFQKSHGPTATLHRL